MQNLPIGIQSFEKIREGGYVYVDKTEYISELFKRKCCYFLSRPRRFGKSLFLSTLEAYFQGRKELFKGLAIDTSDRQWKEYPIIYIDLNPGYYTSLENLEKCLVDNLSELEHKYYCSYTGPVSGHLKNLISTMSVKTGSKVVILVDEYDKPLIETLSNEKLHEDYRRLLKSFYGVLKTCDKYIEFAFITGVSRFSKVSIFSDLNNLRDISMNSEFDRICGITESEMKAAFAPSIDELAAKNGMTVDKCLAKLKKMYDGYHFSTGEGEGVYNPFGLLNCFADRDFGMWWYGTGTPTFLLEELKKGQKYTCEDFINGVEVSVNVISQFDRTVTDPIVLLYQTGYLTIRKYKQRFKSVVLSFPNDEVKFAFADGLSQIYTGGIEMKYMEAMTISIENGDIDGFMAVIQTVFAKIPYSVNDRRDENYYRNLFFLTFVLIGQYCNAETHTFSGRTDLVVFADEVNYVFEFKFNDSPEAALEQIEDKNYSIAFREPGKKIIKIGVGCEFEKEEPFVYNKVKEFN